MAPDTPGEPDRVFLRLENIRGKEGSGIFDVFVRRADEPADAPGIPVGSISLFGVEQASEPDGERAGNGLTKTVEVTKAVDAMQLHEAGAEALDVRLVPRSDVREGDDITVGQVTVHRRSGQ
jgi:tyrosinase